MGNVVKNNMPSLSALNQLNTNNTLLGKALKKVSSGMKINSAADNASAYSISESMRVQLRSLEQCNANTKTGANMVAIAEGAIDNQIDILKRMKEIALDAANDSNTDSDRAIMQKEVNSRLMELNNISYSTEYNGRQLLNGVVPGTPVEFFNGGSAPNQNTVSVVTEQPQSKINSEYPQLDVYDANTYDTRTTVYDPNGTPTWTLSSKSSSSYSIGTTVYDSSGNNYTVINNGTSANPIPAVNVNGTIQNIGTGGFQPYEGALPRVSVSTLASGAQYTFSSVYPATGVQTYTGTTLPDGQQVIVDSAPDSSHPAFYDVKLPTTNLPSSLDKQGFSMICNIGCGQFISIQFDASKPANTATHYPDPNNNMRECYVIGISGLNNVDDIYDSMQQGLMQATGGSGTNTIQISTNSNHEVKLNFYLDANGKTRCYAWKSDGYMNMYDGIIGEVENVGGTLPWQSVAIQGDTVSSQFTWLKLPNTTLSALFPTDDSTWDIEPTKEDYPNPWPNGYDEDRTWPAAWGEDYLKSASLEDKRKRLWREETWPYPVKGAISTATCVSTREKAVKFISSLDQALKYLTNAATTLGVQEVRLNYMNDNIVTSHENTTAAESVIRDADMASEMTNYTKYNVLMQSAQSMLSQSNQNLGSSLDLLK